MKIALDLETAVFQTVCIANMFMLISDYCNEGLNDISNYEDAISFIADMATDNAKQLDKLSQDIVSAQSKSAK